MWCENMRKPTNLRVSIVFRTTFETFQKPSYVAHQVRLRKLGVEAAHPVRLRAQPNWVVTVYLCVFVCKKLMFAALAQTGHPQVRLWPAGILFVDRRQGIRSTVHAASVWESPSIMELL